MTLDTDILVLAGDQEAVERELTAAGCQKLGLLAIGGSTWTLPDGTILDVVVSDAPWAREAIERPLQTTDDIPVIALPYLVLMKLYAGRSQDIADITRMLGGADESALAEVRAAMARHNPEAVNDVESMIGAGEIGVPILKCRWPDSHLFCRDQRIVVIDGEEFLGTFTVEKLTAQ